MFLFGSLVISGADCDCLGLLWALLAAGLIASTFFGGFQNIVDGRRQISSLNIYVASADPWERMSSKWLGIAYIVRGLGQLCSCSGGDVPSLKGCCTSRQLSCNSIKFIKVPAVEEQVGLFF